MGAHCDLGACAFIVSGSQSHVSSSSGKKEAEEMAGFGCCSLLLAILAGFLLSVHAVVIDLNEGNFDQVRQQLRWVLRWSLAVLCREHHCYSVCAGVRL